MSAAEVQVVSDALLELFFQSLSHVQLFCDPMECRPPGLSVSGKNIEVGCHFLFQGILSTQGSNPHLLHWQDSLPTAPPGNARSVSMPRVVSLPPLRLSLGSKSPFPAQPITDPSLWQPVVEPPGSETGAHSRL